MNRLTLVLLLVATAAVASLVTLVLAPTSVIQAQGLVTTRAPDRTAEAGVAGGWAISSYGFTGEPKKRGGDPEWTLGFFAVNQKTGKTSNCIYMWAGAPMNKCVDYAWIELP